jgi:hypothetical protein
LSSAKVPRTHTFLCPLYKLQCIPCWILCSGNPVIIMPLHKLHIDNASVQFLATSVLLLVFCIWLASEKPAWGDGCVALLPTSSSIGCLPEQLRGKIYEYYILLEFRSENLCVVSWCRTDFFFMKFGTGKLHWNLSTVFKFFKNRTGVKQILHDCTFAMRAHVKRISPSTYQEENILDKSCGEKWNNTFYFRHIFLTWLLEVFSSSSLFGFPVCFYAVYKNALKIETKRQNALYLLVYARSIFPYWKFLWVGKYGTWKFN